MNYEKMLNSLLTIINSLKDSDSTVKAFIDELSKEYLDKYRPVAKAIPIIFDKLWDELRPLIIDIIRSFIKEDEEFSKLFAEIQSKTAERRRKKIDIYENLGFDRGQAFELLRIDIISTKLLGAELNKKK